MANQITKIDKRGHLRALSGHLSDIVPDMSQTSSGIVRTFVGHCSGYVPDIFGHCQDFCRTLFRICLGAIVKDNLNFSIMLQRQRSLRRGRAAEGIRDNNRRDDNSLLVRVYLVASQPDMERRFGICFMELLESSPTQRRMSSRVLSS